MGRERRLRPARRRAACGRINRPEKTMSCFVPPHGRIACCAFLALLLAAPAVTADNDKVTVSVVTILATDKNDKVEKKLAGIAAEVQKLNPKLTGFQTVKEARNDVALNTKAEFILVEDQVVTVNVERGADKDNKNTIKVLPPTLGEITYYTSCGKFVPIITEYKTKNGEVLIIAIRVQPCKDK
jgi:hypothetical protein